LVLKILNKELKLSTNNVEECLHQITMVKDEFEKLMHLQAQEFSEKMKKTLEDHESAMVLLKKELSAVDLERQTLRGAHSELNFKLTTERMKIQDMSNKYTLVTSENQRLKLKIVDLQDFEKEKQEFKACKNQFQNIINQMFAPLYL